MKKKLRIRLESFNHELLNTSCQKVRKLLEINNIDNFSIVSLPTKKRIYCVLKSPHVYKDSREHFEIKIHKRIIELFSSTDLEIIDLFKNIDFPAGILSKIELP